MNNWLVDMNQFVGFVLEWLGITINKNLKH